ncbi:LysR family transcriptional regulator [Pseudomonas sp. NPDC089752]|uniref:LysR family transcriptional regulator n=1 Tax=Pseudomonas sp. NPDC089752 TaxID=3364472 RepID=UPI003800A38D
MVFMALYQERNVTRASRQLQIGQPAVSNSLMRLRSLLGDQLFIRKQCWMEPTRRAHEIAQSLMPLIVDVQMFLRTNWRPLDEASAQSESCEVYETTAIDFHEIDHPQGCR